MAVTIDAANIHYRELNKIIKEEIRNHDVDLVLKNINGQRYIADALRGNFKIHIDGIPGNDLAVFMDGPSIIVNGNIQDSSANTMNNGSLVVHGSAGDVLGYGMRGGEVFVRDSVGYRAGIHMKQYGLNKPVMVIGETAGDFLGEYMAGGLILVLNISNHDFAVGKYCGSGMHGGNIVIKGDREKNKGQVKAEIFDLNDAEFNMIVDYIKKYQHYFKIDVGSFTKEDFFKIQSSNLRPYKKLYVGV